MLSKVKVQAKTVSEAITKGLKELRMRRDQVDVTVLEHPKKGFLGFGSKPAVVEVRTKPWIIDELDSEIYMDVPQRRRRGGRGRNARGRGRSNARRAGSRRFESKTTEPRTARVRAPKANEPQLLPSEAIQQAVIPDHLKAPLQEAKDYMNNVLLHMGVKVENLNVWWDEKQQRILITFDCDKPAIVIGKEGKTLEALQYLCTLAVTRKFDTPYSVVADTQNYWRKAEDKINADIERAIDMIKRGSSVFRFRPMSAQLRRYIHRAVEGNEYVQTASEGEGKWRKVTFRPTQKALDEAKAGTAPADFVPGVIGEDVPQPETEHTESAASSSEENVQPQEAPVQAPETANVQTETPVTAAEATEPAAQTSVVQDETPTQKMATQTIAATVASTVVETPEHTVEEHSVIVTTHTEQK